MRKGTRRSKDPVNGTKDYKVWSRKGETVRLRNCDVVGFFKEYASFKRLEGP